MLALQFFYLFLLQYDNHSGYSDLKGHTTSYGKRKYEIKASKEMLNIICKTITNDITEILMGVPPLMEKEI